MRKTFKKLTLLALLIIIPASASAVVISPTQWTTNIINDASSTVTDNNISLRIYKESWATAITSLGQLEGTLEINFNYSTSSDGWWEYPLVSLSNGVDSNFLIPECGKADNFGDKSICGDNIANPTNGMPMLAYSQTSGLFTTSVEVDGLTDLIFAIVPSIWYMNGDHSNTYFDITNISLNYTPSSPETPSPVPEPATMMLFGAGIMGLAAYGRKRKA